MAAAAGSRGSGRHLRIAGITADQPLPGELPLAGTRPDHDRPELRVRERNRAGKPHGGDARGTSAPDDCTAGDHASDHGPEHGPGNHGARAAARVSRSPRRHWPSPAPCSWAWGCSSSPCWWAGSPCSCHARAGWISSLASAAEAAPRRRRPSPACRAGPASPSRAPSTAGASAARWRSPWRRRASCSAPASSVCWCCAGHSTAFALGLLLANLLVGIVLAVLIPVAARFLVSHRASRRQTAFADQLNDTLLLLAGTLRAGYGFMQAADAVAREAESPTSDEFRRLVLETRLGRPVEEALAAMHERVGSVDFGWVVQAIEINLESGGNLAEVLETIAGTIRERGSTAAPGQVAQRRGPHVGLDPARLFPFGLAGVMAVTNPAYLSELFSPRPGGSCS